MNCYLVPHPHGHESAKSSACRTEIDASPVKNESAIHLKSSLLPQSIGRIELIQSILQRCYHPSHACPSCTNLQTNASYISKSLLTFGPTATTSETENVLTTHTSSCTHVCWCKLNIQKKHIRLVRINNEVPLKDEIDLHDGDLISIISPIVPSMDANGRKRPNTNVPITPVQVREVRREVMKFTFHCQPRIQTEIIQRQEGEKAAMNDISQQQQCSFANESALQDSESESPMLSMPMHFQVSTNSSQSLDRSMNIFSALSLSPSNRSQECIVTKRDTNINTSSNNDAKANTLNSMSTKCMKQYRDAIPNGEKGEWKRLVMTVAIESKQEECMERPIPVLLCDTRIE